MSQRSIYIILLLVPLFWGGAFGSTKHALSELPPLTLSALRFSLAGLLLAAWVTARREWNWPLLRRHWPGIVALGFTGVFLYSFFFATGLQYTSSLTASLIVVINPVITACLAVLLLGESWHWRIGAGVTLSLTGVITVITQGRFELILNQAYGRGESIIFGAVLSWVAYTLTAKLVVKHVGSLLATTVSTLAGAVMLLAAAGLREGQWDKLSAISPQTLGELLFLAVFSSLAAYVLFNWGVEQIGATKAAAYINLTPVNALWIAAIFYGEPVLAPQLAGMVLILAGVMLTTRTKTPQPAAAAVKR
ncbi:MAG: DMT family transporter [Sporomusaceae bacterium]|nr:DMT family transporter [Sporomusaceae bacterium]